jgi:Asp-tRNA(Asn)/Glu-tRNA(Gln) amidotransferase B subunit
MKYLLGQGMKKSKGSANPGELEKIFTRLIHIK